MFLIKKSVDVFEGSEAFPACSSNGMIYYTTYIYLTATGLTLGGSSTAHIYAQTIRIIQRTEHT
jgi:hypothetical protein